MDKLPESELIVAQIETMDRFAEMETYVAVVEAGSFVAAADVLGLSKATVSRNVADLETRLGVRLLHRTTRRLSLTEEGQLFYTRSKEQLASLADIEAEVTAKTEAASGLLRVSAPFTFGIKHLAPLWAKFRAEQPGITLEVELADRLVDMVEEGFDVAIRIADLESSSLVSRRLADTRMVLCASPDYLARRGTPTHPEQLTGHDIISFSYWVTRDEWRFDGPDGPVAVRTRPWIHTNNGDTCREIALEGQGIILQPTFLVGDDLADGTLVELMPEYRSLAFGIYAVYPTRKHVPAKVRAFVGFLVGELGQK